MGIIAEKKTTDFNATPTSGRKPLTVEFRIVRVEIEQEGTVGVIQED